MSETTKCLVMADDYRKHFAGLPESEQSFAGLPPKEHPFAGTPDPKPLPFAGWTFGEFLDACRRAGVRDRDRLSGIEFGIHATGTRCVSVTDGDDGIEIRERLS